MRARALQPLMAAKDAKVYPKKSNPDFPELTKLRAFDREQHIRKSMDAGMSRAEAEKHADEDLRERDDGRE